MKIPIPEQDESGKPLSLTKFQEHSIRDILHALDHGAVMGAGTARGALLGDIMGRARPSRPSPSSTRSRGFAAS